MLTGVTAERIYADKGYRGHNAPNPFRVYLSGQRRGVHGIKRVLRRRSAIEPVIGHMKSEGHLGRIYLKGTATAPTPSSLRSATTSASSSGG